MQFVSEYAQTGTQTEIIDSLGLINNDSSLSYISLENKDGDKPILHFFKGGSVNDLSNG